MKNCTFIAFSKQSSELHIINMVVKKHERTYEAI